MYHLRTHSPKSPKVKRSYESVPAKKYIRREEPQEDVETLLKEKVLVSNPRSYTANVPKFSS